MGSFGRSDWRWFGAKEKGLGGGLPSPFLCFSIFCCRLFNFILNNQSVMISTFLLFLQIKRKPTCLSKLLNMVYLLNAAHNLDTLS